MLVIRLDIRRMTTPRGGTRVPSTSNRIKVRREVLVGLVMLVGTGRREELGHQTGARQLKTRLPRAFRVAYDPIWPHDI